MARKNTLNDIDRYFIRGNDSMTDLELSKKLNVRVAAIRAFRDEMSSSEHVTSIKKKGDQFARRGSAIMMTKAQSEIADNSASQPGYIAGCTVKIKKDD